MQNSHGFDLLPATDREDAEIFEPEEDNVGFDGLLSFKKFRSRQVFNDLEQFLEKLRSLLLAETNAAVVRHRNVKVAVCVHAVYEKVTKPEAAPIHGYLRTHLLAVLGTPSIAQVVETILASVRMRHVNFMRESSGLRLKEVSVADLYFSKYNPFGRAGGKFVDVPNFLARKKAIVNVKNQDNRCFAYALLSALHPVQKNATRPQVYMKYFEQYKELESLQYPVQIAALEDVERRLGIPFNVFSFFDDEGRGRYPVYLSKLSDENAKDLLYWNQHYAWIKNFSRFMSDATLHKGASYYCKRCLGRFRLASALANHRQYCVSVDDCKQIFAMPPEDTKLKFTNVRHQQRFPFVVYADFEALTVPCKESTDNEKQQRPINSYQQHQPISVGMKLISSVSQVLQDVPYETHTGTDVVEWFLRRLLEYRCMCFKHLFDEKRLVMTDADTQDFHTATKCYICEKPFAKVQDNTNQKGNSKVRDHDHITGCYRGAAHSACNLKLQKTYKIPIFLHNFRNYDSHLIVPAFTVFKNTRLDVIGQSLEKYLTLTWDETLVFKDSLQFLSSSLEQLVTCLLKSGADKFAHLSQAFSSVTDAQGLALLLRKGVYPYDYMNDQARLQETSLPSREQFFSRLLNRECSEEDYAHAQAVWQAFNCKTMQDYHDLYLKTDVLLLADVFEAFRTATLTTFHLDPSYYVSSPQLSWDCMMKMTGCELTLLSDPAMFTLINSNLRGGISVITKRHAKANNKYMGDLFKPEEPSSYILYLDANNLYGWAMSEPLPFDEFVWISAEECESIDWRMQTDDQEYGFFVECDFHYPDELHDAHNDYPLAPERLLVEEHLLSDEQRDLRQNYNTVRTSTPKLIPNFFPKSNQLVHYRNLRFYLEHGLVLTKVHKAIRFKQARWLRPYVQTNTELRAQSKDPVEVNLRKNMNNTIYGKTCENLTKRTDIKLVASKQLCDKLVNKPHCRRFQVFAPELAAVELQKVKCLINKPAYVGFAVLELSKLHMFKFHYDCLREWYAAAELLFTDTDSLVYQIFTDDLYADLALHKKHFDFSNYPESHSLFSEENKMVMGKMKDESGGLIITEFVGLRPKMYSYTTLTPSSALKESKRAKGIQRAAISEITHADYVSQLQNPLENYVNIRRIGQKHHRLYTLAYRKRGLCAFDDKRFLLADGIRTYAHGHYQIREQQVLEDDTITDSDSKPDTVLLDDQDIENAVILTAEQCNTREIRLLTQREAFETLAGVNLRQTLAQVSTQTSKANNRSGAKRAKTCVDVDEDSNSSYDERMHLIDKAAQLMSFNYA